MRNLLRQARTFFSREIKNEIALARDEARFLAGVQLSRQVFPPDTPLKEVAFRAFSQFGDDGVIQHLIRHIPIETDTFVEFGTESYEESNTRFLLQKDNWRGYILDLDSSPSQFFQERLLHIRHSIDFKQAFITRENINELLQPVAGDIGLMSIDIDGMDYWVWEAIDVASPRIVIAEYQSHFGPELPLTPAYSSTFSRFKNHYTGLCCGASLAAMERLGKKKGYDLIGTAGWQNAYFVRQDVRGSLPVRTAKESWVEVRFRDSRDKDFNYSGLSTLKERQHAMRDALLVNVETMEEKTVAEWFGV
jgi:hypothetical protein